MFLQKVNILYKMILMGKKHFFQTRDIGANKKVDDLFGSASLGN
ncbi:hypothetical protein HPNQ4099_0268 [Helicobacter pylori NQ4099]|uniref:Uncharacterized protein n=2 Tax=Helicobacter pylori TaxID=210 RepID=I9QBC8_HELPX|nr:hypothetical protein HPNQ4099_0268 [Helicobacter pylori NQ4099]EJB35198.1 hypothetical protein HPNQ4076_0064 [Helicobacter pylori NQ4076]